MLISMKQAWKNAAPVPSRSAVLYRLACLRGPVALIHAPLKPYGSECWPDLRDEHELHDLLMSLIAFPTSMLGTNPTHRWAEFYERLEATRSYLHCRLQRRLMLDSQ